MGNVVVYPRFHLLDPVPSANVRSSTRSLVGYLRSLSVYLLNEIFANVCEDFARPVDGVRDCTGNMASARVECTHRVRNRHGHLTVETTVNVHLLYGV